MIISFSPQRRDDDALLLAVDGDVLTINGSSFDLSAATEEVGLDVPEAAGWIVGPASRTAAGRVAVMVVLPYCEDHASEARRFPIPVEVETGPVPLPT